MRRRRISPWLSVAVLLSAPCGCGQSDQQRLQQVRQSVRAWAATVAMVDEHARRGAVPPKYVEQIGESADGALEKQRKELDQMPADDAERNDIYAELARAQEKAQAMENAADEGRRS